MSKENSVRLGYEKYGVDEYYITHRDTYKNPMSDIVAELVKYGELNWGYGKRVLDLCCGSGEVTLSLCGVKESSGLRETGGLRELDGLEILGFDPYTCALYEKNTNKKCLKGSFDDIISGRLGVYRFDTIICSFALHLCEESKLDSLLWQLSLICANLVIITPHKRPDCNGIAFELVDSYKKDRVTIRLYHSKNSDLCS